MFSNMIASLVIHERIETTDSKAKELKRLADRTISWGTSVGELTAKGHDKLAPAEKARIVHAMRMAGRVVKSGEALQKLFGEVAARFKGRPGGYTRVMKTRIRRGDAVSMSFVELIPSDAPPAVEAPAPVEDTKPTKAVKAKAPKAKAGAASAEPVAEKAPAKKKAAKK